jgi:aminomuconate-semialdehyde/2-hydroxymuconate-6-semialdehyde dehydrogenase
MGTMSLVEEIRAGKPLEIPSSLLDWVSKKKKNYIGGRWVDSSEGKTFTTINPASEQVLCDVNIATKLDADTAVAVSREAFNRGDWSTRTLPERARVLREIAEKIDAHRATLAILESLDTGKPIRESFDGDVPRAAQNFQFFADFAESQSSDEFFRNAAHTHASFREAMGVVTLVTPWNLPLYLETWKLAPALLMGNSVCLKPSELTPLTACYLAELLETIDLPPGVFNLLNGLGENSTGQYLTSNMDVDAISFTGETSTGRAIMREAARGPTKVSFELGGKGASVIFEDASLDMAVTECLRAAFRNQGEICLASPRIFVHESKYDAFVSEFVERASRIKIGQPLDYQTEMGALIGAEHYQKVLNYISLATAPATVATGGKRPSHLSKGYFLLPTVILDVPHDNPISREEIFGPVVSIVPFKSEEEAIGLVNDTPYGLSASVWTEDENRAQRVSRQIRTGLVWINCWFVRDLRVPFGGQKRSGLGREGGRYSLDFFSEWKSVCTLNRD